jgi:integrase
MASLELQKGWYRVVFRYGGQKYQRSLETRSKKEAEGQKHRIEENLKLLERGRLAYTPGDDLITLLLSDGKLNAPVGITERVTLAQFFERYQADRPPGKETNTLYTENIHIRHLQRLLGDQIYVGEIPAKLQSYIKARSAEKSRTGDDIGQVTIKKELGTLTSIWNRWGVRSGLVINAISLRNLEYPKGGQKPPFQTWEQIERKIARGKLTDDEQAELWDALFLTVPQTEELLEHVRTSGSKVRNTRKVFPWVYPMFAFIAYTGARRSEMLRSRIEDIDFESGEITIREKKKDRTIKETVRHVPMAEQLREALQGWFKVHPGGPNTFCKTANEPFTEAMATHYLRWTLAGSKWEVMRGFHCLRHSFISNLASRGISERIIMSLAGHLNRETTRRYAHLIPSSVQDAVRLVFNDCASTTAM